MVQSVIAAATILLATNTFTLQSPEFADGHAMPQALRAAPCGGINRSPELRWSTPPARTASFALIVHDPDAPRKGGFYHWVVYDIPADSRMLPSDARLSGNQSGLTSSQRTGYWGPCPPPGKIHHYHFTLYALDVSHLGSPPSIDHQAPAYTPLTVADLEARMAGHILATAVLVGTSETP